MSDNSYLDTNAILNASELVNSTLISKGYIEKKLLFNSINWSELVSSERDGEENQEGTSEEETLPNDLNITEKIYNNDKNIINIIYSLVQSIERNSAQNKTFNKIVSQKDSEIAALQRQVDSLSGKVTAMESKISRIEYNDKIKLDKKIQDLTITNKTLTQNCNKLKNWSVDLRNHFQVQIKKKNLQIDQLKDRLTEKSLTRNIGNANGNFEINQTVIYNNNPSMNNSKTIFNERDVKQQQQQQLTALNEPLKLEYETIMMDLSKLIDNLILENYRFSQFTKLVTGYLYEVNLQISSFNTNLNTIEIPNPSTMIDFESLTNESIVDSDGKTVSDLVNQLESFEAISKPLLNNVYKNYHYLIDLVGNIKQNEHADPKQLGKLKEELEIVRKNWQDAIKTLDEWKRYKA